VGFEPQTMTTLSKMQWYRLKLLTHQHVNAFLLHDRPMKRQLYSSERYHTCQQQTRQSMDEPQTDQHKQTTEM